MSESTPNPRRFHSPPEAERRAMLSAVVPGLGQWRAGDRRLALVYGIPALAAIGVVVFVIVSVWHSGAGGLLSMLVQPRWLWTLVIVNLVLGALRLFGTVQVWQSAPKPDAPPRRAWGWRAAASLLAVVMLLPHLVVHVFAAEALSLLNAVFDGTTTPLDEREADLIAQGFTEEDLGPILEPATTTTRATTTTSSSSTSTSVAPSPSTTLPHTTVTPTTTLVPTTAAPPDPTETLGERITVLLAGGDFGPGRWDLRTDVMMVASLDVTNGKAALISVSRDMVQAPLPAAWAQYNTMLQTQQWHEDREYQKLLEEAEVSGIDPPEPEPFVPCNCFADRINYLHVLTATWVRTFPDAPDPGMEALRQTLEVLLGIPIDYYVLVDFAGFVDLVDVLGGVEVTITESMDVAFSPAREGEDPVVIDVDPGVHLLDGHQALAYVRNRTGSNDNERMRRQRCMIRELTAAADPMTLLRSFPSISNAIKTSTTSTIPLGLLPSIIDVVTSLDPEDIATLAIASPAFAKGRNYMELPIFNTPRVHEGVAQLLTGVAAGTTLGSAEDECG